MNAACASPDIHRILHTRMHLTVGHLPCESILYTDRASLVNSVKIMYTVSMIVVYEVKIIF